MELLLKELKEKGLTLGSVESLTGGLFAASVTSTSGSLNEPAGMPFTFIAYLIDEGFPSQNSALKNGASL